MEFKYKNKHKKRIEPKIYGLQVDDDLIYIGKTHVGNTNGELVKSNLQTCYTNKKINEIMVGSKNVNVIELKNTTICNWYKDRNHEAHFKFVNGEIKLLNDPWVLEGKRCYWDGKVKDRHTIDRMSESKHIKIVQYDKEGNILKIWSSGKEIGIKLIKDYKVINGSGKTKIYLVLTRKTISKRLYLGSYWFKESELKKNFNSIPKKFNIPAIIRYQKAENKKNRKYVPAASTLVYSVDRLSPKGKVINSYTSAEIVAMKFKCSVHSIRRACKSGNKYAGHYWKYGEKKRININKDGKFKY